MGWAYEKWGFCPQDRNGRDIRIPRCFSWLVAEGGENGSVGGWQGGRVVREGWRVAVKLALRPQDTERVAVVNGSGSGSMAHGRHRRGQHQPQLAIGWISQVSWWGEPPYVRTRFPPTHLCSTKHGAGRLYGVVL